MKSQSLRSRLRDWEMLLKAVRENESELAGIAPYLATLERAQRQAVSTLAQRDALVIAAQESTRQLYEAQEAGRESAAALRSYIKSVLGFRTPRLTLFGIKPIHRGGRFGRRCTTDKR
jgi:hypothetical protein